MMEILCPTDKAVVTQVSPDPIRCTVVLISAVQRKLVYSVYLLSQALFGVMWSRDVLLLHTTTHPPVPKPF
jgi:hypothetical protein